MKTKQIMLLLSLASFILFGCNQDFNKSQNEITEFSLVYQTGPNIRPGESVDVIIENVTNKCIEFPTDLSMKIYLNLENNLVETRNLVTYLDNQSVIIEPKGDVFSQAIVYIQPDLDQLSITQPVNSYALITGHVCDHQEQIISQEIPFVITP